MKSNNEKGGDYTVNLYEGTISFTGKKHCRVRAESAEEAKEKVQDLLDSTEYLKVYPDEMDVAKISVQELEDDDSELEYLVECERIITDMIDVLESMLRKLEEND